MVCAYYSTKLVNGALILSEVAIQKGGGCAKVSVRTEQTPLGPLFQAAVCKRLGLTPR